MKLETRFLIGALFSVGHQVDPLVLLCTTGTLGRVSTGISFLYSRLSPSPFRFGPLFRLRVHKIHIVFFPRLASRKGDTTVFCIGKESVQN